MFLLARASPAVQSDEPPFKCVRGGFLCRVNSPYSVLRVVDKSPRTPSLLVLPQTSHTAFMVHVIWERRETERLAPFVIDVTSWEDELKHHEKDYPRWTPSLGLPRLSELDTQASSSWSREHLLSCHVVSDKTRVHFVPLRKDLLTSWSYVLGFDPYLHSPCSTLWYDKPIAALLPQL